MRAENYDGVVLWPVKQSKKRFSIPKGRLAGAVLGVLALVVLWFAPLPLEPRAQHALAITCFMVIFWIGEVIPHAMTGLLGCWMFWACRWCPLPRRFWRLHQRGSLVPAGSAFHRGDGDRKRTGQAARLYDSFPGWHLFFRTSCLPLS